MRPTVVRQAPDSEFLHPEGCRLTELANRDDDPEVSIARARVPPGGATRWHRLDGIVERYVVLAGRGRVDVGDLTGQPVAPGDVVLIPPGCRQRIRNTGREELVFLAICSPRYRPEAYRTLDEDGNA